MKDLKETADLMVSADYKERFIAEYEQVRIRLVKLVNMCDKWDKEELDFTPTCPRELYSDQIFYMYGYLRVLRTRARLEDIELGDKGVKDVKR